MKENSVEKTSRLLEAMIPLAEKVIEEIKLHPKNNIEAMTYYYLCKQCNHLKSYKMLSDNEDSIIVLRLMLEGATYLIWVNKEDSELRAKAWKEYSLKFAAQTLTNTKKINSKFQNSKIPILEEMTLRLKAVPYLKSLLKRKNWFEHKFIADTFNSVGLIHIYNHFYKRQSNWIHWSSFGIDSHYDNGKNTYCFAINNCNAIIMKKLAITCMMEIIRIANDVFSLDIDLSDFENISIIKLNQQLDSNL